MLRIKYIVIALGGALACTACVSTQPAPGGIALGDGERAYQLGKQHLAQHRDGQAEQAFQQAIAADPRHAESFNALAVLYFGQGRFDLAEVQFKRAIATAPQRAHLLANLGFLYLETGRPELALAVLGQAAALVPESQRVQMYMKTAQERVAQSAVVAAPIVAAVPERPAQLREVAPNIWELAAPGVQSATVPTTSVAALAVPGMEGKIEVANGVGARGLARRVGSYMAQQGFAPSRTTNQQPFGQARTEIHYVPGTRALAMKVSKLFAHRPRLVAATNLERNMQLRLVLGKGFVEPQTLAYQGEAADIAGAP